MYLNYFLGICTKVITFYRRFLNRGYSKLLKRKMSGKEGSNRRVPNSYSTGGYPQGGYEAVVWDVVL